MHCSKQKTHIHTPKKNHFLKSPFKLALQLTKKLSPDLKKGWKLSRWSKQVAFSAVEPIHPAGLHLKGEAFHWDSLKSLKDSRLPFGKVLKRASFLYKDFYFFHRMFKNKMTVRLLSLH